MKKNRFKKSKSGSKLIQLAPGDLIVWRLKKSNLIHVVELVFRVSYSDRQSNNYYSCYMYRNGVCTKVYGMHFNKDSNSLGGLYWEVLSVKND